MHTVLIYGSTICFLRITCQRLVGFFNFLTMLLFVDIQCYKGSTIFLLENHMTFFWCMFILHLYESKYLVWLFVTVDNMKAYYILDEILIAGELQESSKKTVARLIAAQVQIFLDQCHLFSNILSRANFIILRPFRILWWRLQKSRLVQ